MQNKNSIESVVLEKLELMSEHPGLRVQFHSDELELLGDHQETAISFDEALQSAIHAPENDKFGGLV